MRCGQNYGREAVGQRQRLQTSECCKGFAEHAVPSGICSGEVCISPHPGGGMMQCVHTGVCCPELV